MSIPTHHLSRGAGDGRPAAPVALVHLGLGNFFRAHQAWYTEKAPDATEWGIAAFTGRRPALAEALTPQDGLYTLVTRAAEADRFEVISSVSRAHAAADHEAWLAYFASPEVRAVTITITEAGYLRAPDGGLDRDRSDVGADAHALRTDPTAPVESAPAKLLAGIAARRRADAGPLTIIPCDNLSDNGVAAARVVGGLAEMVDPALLSWLEEHVSYVTTMVDRITPRPTDDTLRTVADATGVQDRTPVVTEPFSEWVLSGEFVAGRPGWEVAGATFTDDISPFEERKLWLLNGGHSCSPTPRRSGGTRASPTRWRTTPVGPGWSSGGRRPRGTCVSRPLTSPPTVPRSATGFANPRMRHRLDQIASDGSQKLPVRILPALRLERADGRLSSGAIRVLAAWVCHLRGLGAPVTDARADEVVPLAAGPLPAAVQRVLDALDPVIGADDEVVTAVLASADELGRP